MPPGPTPKHPSARARNNKTSTVAYLQPVENPVIPPLPTGRKWRSETRKWWKVVWSSPMSSEYDESDREALARLAILQDEFYRVSVDEDISIPKLLNLSAEIRQQEQRFGLSPMDRRRLQWTIEQGEEAAAKTAARQQKARAEAGPRPVEEDPRAMLA